MWYWSLALPEGSKIHNLEPRLNHQLHRPTLKRMHSTPRRTNRKDSHVECATKHDHGLSTPTFILRWWSLVKMWYSHPWVPHHWLSWFWWTFSIMSCPPGRWVQCRGWHNLICSRAICSCITFDVLGVQVAMLSTGVGEPLVGCGPVHFTIWVFEWYSGVNPVMRNLPSVWQN